MGTGVPAIIKICAILGDRAIGGERELKWGRQRRARRRGRSGRRRRDGTAVGEDVWGCFYMIELSLLLVKGAVPIYIGRRQGRRSCECPSVVITRMVAEAYQLTISRRSLRHVLRPWPVPADGLHWVRVRTESWGPVVHLMARSCGWYLLGIHAGIRKCGRLVLIRGIRPASIWTIAQRIGSLVACLISDAIVTIMAMGRGGTIAQVG